MCVHTLEGCADHGAPLTGALQPGRPAAWARQQHSGAAEEQGSRSLNLQTGRPGWTCAMAGGASCRRLQRHRAERWGWTFRCLKSRTAGAVAAKRSPSAGSVAVSTEAKWMRGPSSPPSPFAASCQTSSSQRSEGSSFDVNKMYLCRLGDQSRGRLPLQGPAQSVSALGLLDARTTLQAPHQMPVVCPVAACVLCSKSARVRCVTAGRCALQPTASSARRAVSTCMRAVCMTAAHESPKSLRQASDHCTCTD